MVLISSDRVLEAPPVWGKGIVVLSSSTTRETHFCSGSALGGGLGKGLSHPCDSDRARVGFEGKDTGLKYMTSSSDSTASKSTRVPVDEAGDAEGEYSISCRRLSNASLYAAGSYRVGCNNVGASWREGSKIGSSSQLSGVGCASSSSSSSLDSRKA